MARRTSNPYQSRRERTRGRLLLFSLIAFGILIAIVFLLAQRGGEQPQHWVEQPVQSQGVS